MPHNTLFAYLDHNVLDLMTKGDPDGVEPLLARLSLVPVFSNENLEEIRRSVGYESTFIDLLNRIGARYLLPETDSNFKLTGRAEVRRVNAFDAYSAYVESTKPLPDTGFGLAGFLEKFYGGRRGDSFTEVFSKGGNELAALLEELTTNMHEISGVDSQDYLEIIEQLRRYSDQMREQLTSVGVQMDAAGEVAFVKQFEQEIGLGPKVLKNVCRPNVLQQIWQLVEDGLPAGISSFETFFGIKPCEFEMDANRERTTLEKVNSIYHQLNVLGYFRDSSMNNRRRFIASLSDMTHAGLATFCHTLICRDEDLVMKASAAYEYLGVRTIIMYYPPKGTGKLRIEHV